MFNLHPIVVASVAVMVLIHVARMALSGEADFELLLDFGFIPAQWSVALGWAEANEVVRHAARAVVGEGAALRAAFARYLVTEQALRPWSPLTYALLHGSWMHLGLNSLWFVAFASPVVVHARAARFAVLCVLTALGGALVHWIANRTGVQPMIGVSAVVSGMMGAVATFAFERPAMSALGLPNTARRVAKLGHVVRNRTSLLFLGSWFLLNLLFGIGAPAFGLVEHGIAWEAHIGGLLTGLFAYPLLQPRAPALRT
jgi:membrane associated rhomboid family serine protease